MGAAGQFCRSTHSVRALAASTLRTHNCAPALPLARARRKACSSSHHPASHAGRARPGCSTLYCADAFAAKSSAWLMAYPWIAYCAPFPKTPAWDGMSPSKCGK